MRRYHMLSCVVYLIWKELEHFSSEQKPGMPCYMSYILCVDQIEQLTEYRKMIRTDVNTYSYFFEYHSQSPQPYQIGTRIKSVNS